MNLELLLAGTKRSGVYARLIDGPKAAESPRFVHRTGTQEETLQFTELRNRFALVTKTGPVHPGLPELEEAAVQSVLQGFMDSVYTSVVVGITTHYCAQLGLGAAILPCVYEHAKCHTQHGALYLFSTEPGARSLARTARTRTVVF